MEYAAAKSSICRQCGRSFSPFAPKPGLKLRTTEEAPAQEPSSSIFGRFEDFWKRQTSSVIECFECKRETTGFWRARLRRSVPHAVRTLICGITRSPAASAEAFAPEGTCTYPARAIWPAAAWSAGSALVEGRLRGNLHCNDTATINYSGKIPGRISARHVVVDRKADIHCFRTVRAENIEIKGRMSGEIIAQMVTVHKKGWLEGDVTARAISVEKGGMFSGQLAIGQIGLTQGELLGQREPTVSPGPESNFPDPVAHPLPAT